MDMIERVARAIAFANGDNFSDAFKSKSRWIAKRGESGGRFRDVNEPFQSDYIDMACAAINALAESTLVYRDNGNVVHEMRGAPDDIWKTLLTAAIGREDGDG
jgi:hypothetical protein